MLMNIMMIHNWVYSHNLQAVLLEKVEFNKKYLEIWNHMIYFDNEYMLDKIMFDTHIFIFLSVALTHSFHANTGNLAMNFYW